MVYEEFDEATVAYILCIFHCIQMYALYTIYYVVSNLCRIMSKQKLIVIIYSAFLDTQRRFTVEGGPHSPPPMCSTHLGVARQPISTRTLTTHQLEVESEGIN